MKLRRPAPQLGRRSTSSGRAKGEDEDGVVARPVEQVLDEVQQRRVGPLHVLEGHDDWLDLGHALEEEPPGGEQVLLVPGDVGLLEADQVGEARLDPAALVGVGDVLMDSRRGASRLTEAASSPSRIPARPRTISARAQ